MKFSQILGPAGLTATWYLAADVLHYANPVALPPLSDVLERLQTIIVSGEAWLNTQHTLSRYLCGLGLGIGAGLLLGILLGSLRALHSLLEFPIEFLRALPVTALLPVFFVLFGIGDSGKIAMVSYPTCLLVSVNTHYGLSRISPQRIKVGRLFGASRFQLFCRIVVFEALPQIFVGIRLALSLALVVAIAAEMFVGTESGLGQKMFDSYLTSSTITLYAYLLITGCTGYAVTKLFLQFEQRFMTWG